MSLNLNHVVLAGHLTRDPELRQIGADRVVANTGLATNRRWKDPATGEQREEATFVDLEAWGRTAELMGQYLKKGSAAYIEGRLKLDQWDDKDGQKRTRLRVVVDVVQFLTQRQAEGGAETGEEGAASKPAPVQRTPSRGRAAPARAGATATMDGEPPF